MDKNMNRFDYDSKELFYKIKKYTEKLKLAKDVTEAKYYHRKLRHYHRINSLNY